MKITKNQQKFKEYLLKNISKCNLETQKEIREIVKAISTNQSDIENIIGKIMLKYNISDDKMNMSFSEVIKEFKSITNVIDNNFKSEISKETKEINNYLTYIANNSYDTSEAVLSAGIILKLKKISSTKLEKILNKKIKGENYSSRIHNNKNKIAIQLKKEIKLFLEGEINTNEINKKLQYIFNMNKNISKRLIINEVARVQSEVNEVWANDRDIQYQLFDATLDNKTSDICQKLDGNVYEINDSNKPIPAINTHICCRSCLIALPNKDWKPKTRIDNIVKNTVGYSNYSEWAENVLK